MTTENDRPMRVGGGIFSTVANHLTPGAAIKARVEVIAEARRNLLAWQEERYDELPLAYTHESIKFDVDLRTVLEAAEVACGTLWLFSEKL